MTLYLGHMATQYDRIRQKKTVLNKSKSYEIKMNKLDVTRLNWLWEKLDSVICKYMFKAC